MRSFVANMQKNQNEFVTFFEALVAKELPIVLFRLPKTQEIVLYQQLDSTHHQSKTLTENGFVFAPFQAKESYTYIPNQLETRFVVLQNPKPYLANNTVQAQNKSYYMELIDAAKKTITQSSLKKVVVSREHKQEFSGSIAASFLKLTQAYPNAMVYYWSHPHTGDWMGATPETLLDIQNGVCKTMALAGTFPFDENKEPSWTSKELDEQQMVTDFIQTQLQRIFSKDSIYVSPTHTKRAGNLMHLCANFEVPLGKATALDIVRLLHPTPAVAGVPVKESLTFLSNYERHDRKYYAGILGPITKGAVRFFVNLRCAEVTQNQITLYVGGGITAKSHPEMEWTESQHKAETLLNVL